MSTKSKQAERGLITAAAPGGATVWAGPYQPCKSDDGKAFLAIEVLKQVKNLLGRNYKTAIREAWMTGNYDAQCLGQWSSQLQQIRNTFGPSWLVRARA